MHPGCGTRATDDWARGQGDPTGRFGKGNSRAGAVPHDGDGDGRRRAASQGVGPGAFDARLAGAPQNGGDANLWSPEASTASMARGGVLPENTTAANTNQDDVPGCNREGERVG